MYFKVTTTESFRQTRPPSVRAALRGPEAGLAPVDVPEEDREDPRDDVEVHVLRRLREDRPAVQEVEACDDEDRVPDRRAHRRERHEPPEVHPADPGGERDDRPHAGDRVADEDPHAPITGEPGFRPAEVVRAEA